MQEVVEEYYGRTLTKTTDLRTNACTTSARPDSSVRALISNVHPQVNERYFGCGLVYPPVLAGMRVLDLGCGSGRDCYVLSQLVGPGGRVVGVDMTAEQLAVARAHERWHAEKFGFEQSNVEFLQGNIERLSELDLAPGSFDIIVSNCVINLATDKAAVLKDAYELLAEGGEMYFSDVYANRRVPLSVREDPVLYGECLGGALYWNDFENLARACGFSDPRLVEDNPISITDETLSTGAAGLEFYSATYRLFKLGGLEPACEDYGQAVIYRGGIDGNESIFRLDKHHVIERGRVFPVCGNTWRMLKQTRFAEYFDFVGSFETHYGIFEGCGSALPFAEAGSESTAATSAASCC